ncbi:MAG: HK97 gp10 family phage protein [Enterocloster sp.]
MSSSNYRRNKAFIDQYRKELMSMVDDIREIDIRVLNQAVNEGMRYAKKNSPVITGFYRKNWRSAPAVRSKDGGVTKNLVNSADYASYVNYGHRTVDQRWKYYRVR